MSEDIDKTELSEDNAEELNSQDLDSEATEQEKTSQTKTKGSGFATFLGALALLVSLGGIGTGYYFYNQETQRQLDESTETTSALEESLSLKTADMSARFDDKFQALDTSMNESAKALQSSAETVQLLLQRQQALEDNLTLMRNETSRSKREWSLAEVQYLIQIAADRLAFMRDRGTAIAALKTAQSRLQKLSDSSLAALSRRLNDDIRTLENDQPNNPLDTLQPLENEINQLVPLPTAAADATKAVAESESETEPATASLRDTVQNTLLKRFKVRHHEKPLNALDRNTVERQYLSMLQLRLEGLRLALQQDNQTAFKHARISFRQWVVTHLDGSQQQPIVAALDGLTIENVFPPPPNLEETQSILRALLNQAKAGSS